VFKLRCKRHYRNIATYSWCTTWLNTSRKRRGRDADIRSAAAAAPRRLRRTALQCRRIVNTDFVFLDEVDERRAFNLDRLALAIVERQNEVKEVALAKIAWWLLLEMSSSNTQTIHVRTRIHYTQRERNQMYTLVSQCRLIKLFQPSRDTPR